MPADTPMVLVPREAGEWAMSLPGNHFQRGAQACREMMARFVEATHPEIAQSIRLNWHPGWGADPGRPPAIVATWEPEPCPAGEAARAALEASDESGDDDLELTARMLEAWGPVVEPASPDGKVSFTRAMMDSAATAIRRALSASPAREGDLGSSASPIPTEGLSGGKDDWPTDNYRAVALGLCKTVEGLITGLPDLLKTGDLKDEEGLIDEAFRTLDAAAFRLAQLDLEAEEDAPTPGEGDAPVAWALPDDLAAMADGRLERAAMFAARQRRSRGRVALYTRPTPATPAIKGEVTDEWAERFCEAVNWSPDGQECKTVEGQLRCVSFRDLAKGYILAAIATDPCTPATPEGLREKEWLTQPLRWRRPRRIFVAAHGDLFHDGVTDDQLDRIFAVMALCPQHTFQVLTKRPERMRAYLTDQGGDGSYLDLRIGEHFRRLGADFNRDHFGFRLPLPNVWLGVSVEDQTRADERIPLLLDTPAALHWISVEPLLGPVDLTRVGRNDHGLEGDALRWRGFSGPSRSFGPRVAWVVAGGESGPGARPMHPAWARQLRDQCAAAGVPFLFKQWGDWAPNPAISGVGHADGTGQPCAAWPDGTIAWGHADQHGGPGIWLNHVGKAKAGRLLDGQLHDAYPEARP